MASGPRGLNLSERPISANSLTHYLQLRGQKIGYPEPLTFYSIRRRAANDLTRQIGADAARTIMNHAPESRVLERYYLALENTTDISGLGLGEAKDLDAAGQSEILIVEDNVLALNALTDDRLRNVYGPALNTLMAQVMMQDPNYPVDASPAKIKNYKRRVRYRALRSLLAKESQDLRQKISQMDYEARLASLESSRVTELIVERARAQIQNAPEAGDVEANGDPAVDINTGEFTHSIKEVPEDDLNNQEVPGATGVVSRELDENKGEDQDDDMAVPYLDAVEAFLETILGGTLSIHRDLKNKREPCLLCQDDETIDQKLRVRFLINPLLSLSFSIAILTNL